MTNQEGSGQSGDGTEPWQVVNKFGDRLTPLGQTISKGIAQFTRAAIAATQTPAAPDGDNHE